MYDVEKYIINFLELFKMKIEHEQKHEEALRLQNSFKDAQLFIRNYLSRSKKLFKIHLKMYNYLYIIIFQDRRLSCLKFVQRCIIIYT